MKKLFIFIILLVIMFQVSSSMFQKAQAEYTLELKYPPIAGVSPEGGLVNYIGYIYRLGLVLVGLAALFALVFGGFLYMSESVTKTEEGKKWIWGALGGLLLALLAYLILYTINPDLVKLSL